MSEMRPKPARVTGGSTWAQRGIEQLELATEGALQPGRPVAILYLVVHGAKAGPGVSSGK